MRLNPKIEFMSKAMDFYPLQKDMGKNLSSKYGQKLLDTTKEVIN